jgi:hypothetical protein
VVKDGVNSRVVLARRQIMEIKLFMNGIKVYTPIAISKLYDRRVALACRSECLRRSQSEKVRRIRSYMNESRRMVAAESRAY